jgi:hypothetical protein
MADGLLNKASIILTPTGYKAGTLYNVAPIDEPYEDFDFARASVASRVNSSGLVEMVGRTLGSELVTNGDFSNGTTDWTNASSDTFEVVDGGVGHSTSLHIVVSAVNRGAYQSVFVADKTYYVSLDLKVVSGSVYIGKNTRKLNNQNYNNSDWQTITGYLVAIDDKIRIYSNEASEFYVDNVSVKEVIDTNNIPRISYDSNGENGHILLEPTSTNLIPYSEDFTQWSALNGGTGSLPVVTSNTTISPSGEQNADTISFDKGSASGGGDYSLLRLDYGGADVDGTASIYLKADTNVDIEISSDDGSYQTVSVTNTWQRFSVSDATSDRLSMGLRGTVPSNNTATVYAWGGQLEALPYATSYIPTYGSTVTRATETATGAGSADLINSTEGVLYAEIESLVNGGVDRIISLSDETNNNLIYIRIDNTANRINSFARGGGGTYNILTVNGVNQTNTNKIALVWDASNVRVWINGSQSLTQSINNLPTGMKTLSFTSPTGGSPFYGKVKAVAVFNEALSDSELTQLTT